MNETLYVMGWFLKAIELFIVLFLVKKFTKLRWSLFFGGRKDLKSIQHHELHSCFLTAFCVVVFHFANTEIDLYILSLEMEKVAKIRLFYLSKMIMHFSFIATVFCLHLIRGCSFSPAARKCSYATIVFMMFQLTQLIARGYYDYHELNVAYVIVGWICNFVIVSAVAVYPIKELKEYIKDRRERA